MHKRIGGRATPIVAIAAVGLWACQPEIPVEQSRPSIERPEVQTNGKGDKKSGAIFPPGELHKILASHDRQGVLNQLETLLQDYPQDPRLHVEYGQLALYQKGGEFARSFLAESTKTFPENGMLRLLYARALTENNNFEVALIHFEAASDKTEFNSDDFSQWARAFYEAGETQNAIDTAKKALNLQRGFVPASRLLGEIYLQNEKTQAQGIALLQRVVRKEPRDTQSHYKLGKALADAGEREQACYHLRQALSLLPLTDGQRDEYQATIEAISKSQVEVEPRSSHILVISIDSLRADHLSAYGYRRHTSPNIDALAEGGIRFETAIAPTSWTLPSHATLLSGLSPKFHGVNDGRSAMAAEHILLPEYLSRAGYATGGVVAGPYLSSNFGLNQGYDFYDDYSAMRHFQGNADKGITSPTVVEKFNEWLSHWDQNGREKPLFTFLHFWDVHHDYAPPPPFDTQFDPDYQGTIDANSFEFNDKIHKDMNPRDLEHIIALYDGEIAFTDAHIGKVIDALKRYDIYDNTLIVLTSDHGDEFFEHGEKGHGKNLYDTTIKVPLIFHHPQKLAAGKVVYQQARLMDIMPTVLDIAGVDYQEQKHRSLVDRAVSLKPQISGQPSKFMPSISVLEGDQVALRTTRNKLMKYGDSFYFYNLYRDRKEAKNRYSKSDSLVTGMQRIVDTWMVQTTHPEESAEIDATLQNELKALGYLD